MKLKVITVFLFVSVFNGILGTAQISSQTQLSSVNVDNLSDSQIQSYWGKAKDKGYTVNQIGLIAKTKGMSESQILKLMQRINELKYPTSPKNSNIGDASKETLELNVLEKFGLTDSRGLTLEKSMLFGYDFFNNPTISFTPNLNVAVPTNYQIGPGDELLIDIWGAAQNNYRKKVDTQGAIRIENIGPVYVSGLSIDKAKKKIISYLKKIYSGISAANSSYNKIHADVSLVGIRTVQVNIIGEVKVPGTYSLTALSTVLNALYAAGGPTEQGTFRNVQLIRTGKLYNSFDIYKYLINGSEKGNSLLQDQDVIIVSPYIHKIEVLGKVKREGIYELTQGETIDHLIQYFGGFSSNAYKKILFVERVNGEQKEMKEIALQTQPNFTLQDGDILTVGEVINRFQNRVSIAGAIYRPGNYELTNNLTLLDLFIKAAGVKDNAFMDRGIIYRTIDDVSQEIISFSVRNIMEEKTAIILKREDSIHIFNKHDLKEKQTITIDGAVNIAQTISYIEKMRIEDLIAISGGFKEGADPTVIDISRRVADGSFTTISKNIKKSSSGKLATDNNYNFYLQAFDRVSVRYLKGFTAQKNVGIRGEVTYPGIYSIATKDERISDLIQKAGGFSPYAYLKGATLVRKLAVNSDKQQLATVENLILKDTLNSTLDIKNEVKIGIDLVKIMQKNGARSKIDLILQEGDVLYVPTEKQTVEVRGEVFSPSLSRFDKSKRFKDYIINSGGYSEDAKKGKAYIVYANGNVRSAKRFLFFKTYPKIQPGSLIIVPKKSERKRMSIQEVVGITSGVTALGILINTLVR